MIPKKGHYCYSDKIRKHDPIWSPSHLDSGLFVKRLQFDPLGFIDIRSDNQVYSGVTISKEAHIELHIVGLVVWAGKKF